MSNKKSGGKLFMEQNNLEVKKPFYKKWWFIVVAIIAVIAIIGAMSGNGEEKSEKLNWEEIELNEFIPEPEKPFGKITFNRSDLATIEISKLTKKEYKDYVQKCIDKGYTIDLEYKLWDTAYGAFNEEGYSIYIIYRESEEEMGITLRTPKKNEMKEIEWSTNGLGAMLPKPKSNLGNISWNNSETFIADIGNTTINDYNEYVKACEDKGFTNNYSKSDKSYSATNSEGYKLHLMYLGSNVIQISLKASETNNSSSTENTKPSNSSGIGKEFKQAMDSYEAFMDEYIAFMKKYSASNGTDTSLLSDYSKYMTKYAKVCEDFAKWEDDDLNSDEISYYAEVQLRVSQKLLKISN